MIHYEDGKGNWYKVDRIERLHTGELKFFANTLVQSAEQSAYFDSLPWWKLLFKKAPPLR